MKVLNFITPRMLALTVRYGTTQILQLGNVMP